MRIHARRLFASLLVALALLPVALTGGPALADTAPKMTLQWGLGGQAVSAGWMPVVIDVTGGTQAIDGTLWVDPAAMRDANVSGRPDGRNPGDQAQPYMQRPIHIAAGGKQRVVVWVPATLRWQPKVQLKTGATVVAEGQLEMKPDGGSASGLILAPEGDLTNLGSMSVAGKGQLRWGRLTVQDLPESAAQLGAVDVMVLGRVDTRPLTDAQKQALTAWVATGGRLLIVGGPEAATAAAGLPPELLPATLGGQATADVAPLLAMDTATVGTAVPAASAPIVQLTPKEGARVVVGSQQTPLAVRKQVGQGSVLYLAADPSLAPLAGEARLGPALSALLPVSASQFDPRMENGAIGQLTTDMQGLQVPKGSLLLLLLAGYIVVLGPLQYLVLKKLDRRELMWLTTPALAVVLMGVAWVGATGMRGLLTSTHSVTELAPGQAVATETDIVGVFSPTGKGLTIQMPKGALVQGPQYYGGNVVSPIWEGDSVRFEQLSDYTPSGIMVTHQVKLAGGLQLTDVKFQGDQFSARVENKTGANLKDVRLVGFGIQGVGVGDLAAGAQQTINTTITSLLPDLHLNPGEKGGISVGPMAQWNGPEDGPQPWLKQNLIQSAIQASSTSGSTNFWLIGMADAPPATWPLDLPQGHNSMHVVFSAVSLLPAGPVRTLPVGLVSGALSDRSVQYGPGMQMVDAGEHQVQFLLPALAPEAKEIQLTVAGQGPAGGATKFKVRNWRTNAWDEGANVVTAADHVGPGGLVQARFTTDASFNVTNISVAVREGK